jgi:hypothetical protein
VILILMMIYRPEGIIPARRRRLESFHRDGGESPLPDPPDGSGLRPSGRPAPPAVPPLTPPSGGDGAPRR